VGGGARIPLSCGEDGAAVAAAPIVTEVGGIRLFAGQRDDPFFFDFVGFTGFLGASFTPAAETPADTFAGTNVSSIVVELPITQGARLRRSRTCAAVGCSRGAGLAERLGS
jgi:hypothetical protein